MQVSATCWAILPYWALGTCLVRTITESHRPTEPAEPAPASDGNVIPNTSFGTWPLGRTPITVVPLKANVRIRKARIKLNLVDELTERRTIEMEKSALCATIVAPPSRPRPA